MNEEFKDIIEKCSELWMWKGPDWRMKRDEIKPLMFSALNIISKEYNVPIDTLLELAYWYEACGEHSGSMDPYCG